MRVTQVSFKPIKWVMRQNILRNSSIFELLSTWSEAVSDPAFGNFGATLQVNGITVQRAYVFAATWNYYQ